MKHKTAVKPVNLHKGSIFEITNSQRDVYLVTDTYKNMVRLYSLKETMDIGWVTHYRLSQVELLQIIDPELDTKAKGMKEQFAELKNKNGWVGNYKLIYYSLHETGKALICFVNQYDGAAYGYGDKEGNILPETFTLIDYRKITRIPLESI